MKKIIPLAAAGLFLFVFSCGKSESRPANTDGAPKEDSVPATENKNQPQDTLAVVTDTVNESGGKPDVVRTLSLRLLVTRPYCGGAPPPQEILDEARKPHAAPGEKLFFKKGKVNTLKPADYSAVTDDNGNLKVDLPEGDWCVCTKEQMVSPQLHSELYEHPAAITDMKAYRQWWNKCLLVVNVNSQSKALLSVEANCMTNSICPLVENPQAKLLP